MALLKTLQTTKGQTYEEIKQTLEALCSVQITITQRQEKENQHMIRLLLIKRSKNKTKTNNLTLTPNIGKLVVDD